MRLIDCAVKIHEQLDVTTALEHYGIAFNNRGFAICPLHSEDTASFKIWNRTQWHCFGCNKTGDIIDFVMESYGLTWYGAVSKINSDFALNLPIGRRITLGESMAMSKKLREIKAERERKRAERDAAEAAYNAVWDEYARLDYNYIHYKPPVPSSPDTELHPLFIEALQKLEYYRYLTQITPLPESGEMQFDK